MKFHTRANASILMFVSKKLARDKKEYTKPFVSHSKQVVHNYPNIWSRTVAHVHSNSPVLSYALDSEKALECALFALNEFKLAKTTQNRNVNRR